MIRIKIHNIFILSKILLIAVSALRSVRLTCFSPSRSPSIIKTVDYQLDYELTPLQNNISRQLLQRYQQHLNTSLKAVCGAGKTEITYEGH